MPEMLPLLDYHEVAAVLGDSKRHSEGLVYRREIPFIKVGRKVRFDTRDLHEWLDANRTKAAQ